MTTTARFQVAETKHGYVVKDTRDGSIWTKTYISVGWATRKAVQLNDAHRNRKYFAKN
jgi:hypothetical protein